MLYSVILVVCLLKLVQVTVVSQTLTCSTNCVPKTSTELAVDRVEAKVDTLAQQLTEVKNLLNTSSKKEPCYPVLIQQNLDGYTSTYFGRSWQEYKVGFGSETGNYWIGNEALHQLTTSPTAVRYRFRVIVWTKAGKQFWAEYDSFTVGNETSGYRLNVSGFRGTVEFDGMAEHNGMKFSTYDRDQDLGPSANCAVLYGGGWWYRDCAYVALNAKAGSGFDFKWNFLPGDPAGSLSFSKASLVCR